MEIYSKLRFMTIANSLYIFLLLTVLILMAMLIYRRRLLALKQFTTAILLSVLFSGIYYSWCMVHYKCTAKQACDFLKEAFADDSITHVIYHDEETLEKYDIALNGHNLDDLQDAIFNGSYKITYPHGAIEASDPIKVYFHNYTDVRLTVSKPDTIEIWYDGSEVKLISDDGDLFEIIKKIICNSTIAE